MKHIISQNKWKRNKNIKEQFEIAIQNNINLQKQNDQDKSELQEALIKLDQINKFKTEQEIQLKIEGEKFNNIINQYNFQILISIVVYKQVKVQRLLQKLIMKVGIFVFVNKQFQRQEKYHLHSKYLVDPILWLELIQRNYVKHNYQNCYQVGFGTYLIAQNGQTFSHHNKDVYNQYLSFKFTNNDIIIIEVCIEYKYIKWSRQNNSQTCVYLDIDTSQELYPCVGIYKNSNIKLLENIPDS